MRKRRPTLVWGVDPSNTLTGLAVVHRVIGGDPVLRFCGSFRLWHEDEMEVWLRACVSAYGPPKEIWVEVPDNGTHKSRGGVQRAGGIVIGALRVLSGMTKSSVVYVGPGEWRKHIFGVSKADDWKSRAIVTCKERLGWVTEVHDEAEAALIALHGATI